jgi:DNA-binding MarR family transcriptional regulator
LPFGKKACKPLINQAHDRRLTLLAETPEGFAVWKESMQAFNQSSSELISTLSEYHQVNAIKLLKKLERAFKRK